MFHSNIVEEMLHDVDTMVFQSCVASFQRYINVISMWSER